MLWRVPCAFSVEGLDVAATALLLLGVSMHAYTKTDCQSPTLTWALVPAPQPPWDAGLEERRGRPWSIIHYTYGLDYNFSGGAPAPWPPLSC